MRLPFKWERAQRSLGGPLDAGYMGLIVQMLKDTKTAGMLAILDMHNYARYKSNGVYGIIGQSNGPTTAHYADVWKKISAHIKAVPDAHNALYAYDIMNEPHDIPGAGGLSGAKIWEKYAQVAVDAIRSNGDKKMIHIEGEGWSSPTRWTGFHPVPFIKDSANNIMYHAHTYMDNHAGGKYLESFDQENYYARKQGFASVADRAIKRLKPFHEWCTKYNVRCFVGEFGWRMLMLKELLKLRSGTKPVKHL